MTTSTYRKMALSTVGFWFLGISFVSGIFIVNDIKNEVILEVFGEKIPAGTIAFASLFFSFICWMFLTLLISDLAQGVEKIKRGHSQYGKSHRTQAMGFLFVLINRI